MKDSKQFSEPKPIEQLGTLPANKQSQPNVQKSNNSSDSFYIFLVLSFILHLLAIYIFLFGLPHFSKKNIVDSEDVITFEMLAVSEVSNVQTQIKQTEKAIENDIAKDVQQSKPKQVPPEKKPDEPKPLEPEVKEEVKADAEAIVKPREVEKKPEPQAKKKENIEVPEKKEPKKKLPTDNDLDSLLKTLEQSSKGNNAKSAKHSRAQENNVTKTSKGPFNALLLLSISEQNLIKQQIQRHWNIPLAAQNIDEVIIILHIELNKDGSVADVKVIDKVCPNMAASVCQALASSAERAVLQASPIKNLSLENYDKWKEFNLSFYPKDSF